MGFYGGIHLSAYDRYYPSQTASHTKEFLGHGMDLIHMIFMNQSHV